MSSLMSIQGGGYVSCFYGNVDNHPLSSCLNSWQLILRPDWVEGRGGKWMCVYWLWERCHLNISHTLLSLFKENRYEDKNAQNISNAKLCPQNIRICNPGVRVGGVGRGRALRLSGGRWRDGDPSSHLSCNNVQHLAKLSWWWWSQW